MRVGNVVRSMDVIEYKSDLDFDVEINCGVDSLTNRDVGSVAIGGVLACSGCVDDIDCLDESCNDISVIS